VLRIFRVARRQGARSHATPLTVSVGRARLSTFAPRRFPSHGSTRDADNLSPLRENLRGAKDDDRAKLSTFAPRRFLSHGSARDAAKPLTFTKKPSRSEGRQWGNNVVLRSAKVLLASVPRVEDKLWHPEPNDDSDALRCAAPRSNPQEGTGAANDARDVIRTRFRSWRGTPKRRIDRNWADEA
jgi:hypothetical protein